MIVVTVLRSGGIYTPNHVRWLANQLPSGVRHICLSDMRVPDIKTLPLAYGWPGWWSKMELFNPQGPLGDQAVLYFDLDTVITGSIDDLLAQTEPMILSDWYHDHLVNSSVMLITPESRQPVWDAWMQQPDVNMHDYERWGDQSFIGEHFNARHWQDVLPNQLISYKVHVLPRSYSHRSQGDGSLPPHANVVCFHGKPRPWPAREPWIPGLLPTLPRALPAWGNHGKMARA